MLTTAECSRVLGISDTNFRNYLAAGKILRNEFHRYDPDTCREQIKAYIAAKLERRRNYKMYREDPDAFPCPEPMSFPAFPALKRPLLESFVPDGKGAGKEEEQRQEQAVDYHGLEETLRSGHLAHSGVNGNRTLSEANRILAWQKVQREQLESDVRAGKYISLEEVNQYISTVQLKARDLFLRIGPELQDQIAQESDPLNVEYMITLEINRALSEMAGMEQTRIDAKTATGKLRRAVKSLDIVE